MFFSVFVLVPVESEHNNLEQAIDLLHRDHSREVSDVFGRALKEEEHLPVQLKGGNSKSGFSPGRY